MADKIFVNGMMFKLPRDGAPEFVKGSVSVKVDEFIEFAKEHQNNGWVNVDLLIGKSGKPYCALNTWKPEKQEDVSTVLPADNGAPFEDDIPFIQKDRFMVI
jgi:hypothetical protein